MEYQKRYLEGLIERSVNKVSMIILLYTHLIKGPILLNKGKNFVNVRETGT